MARDKFNNGDEYILHFHVDEPLPFGLIKRVVEFRAKENTGKAHEKRKK